MIPYASDAQKPTEMEAIKRKGTTITKKKSKKAGIPTKIALKIIPKMLEIDSPREKLMSPSSDELIRNNGGNANLAKIGSWSLDIFCRSFIVAIFSLEKKSQKKSFFLLSEGSNMIDNIIFI